MYCKRRDNLLCKKISYICEYEYKYFLKKLNVVGVALGYKVTKGFYTCEKCIKVLVSRKIRENQLNSQDIIPKMYKGIRTDVVDNGYISVSSLTKKIRPAIGGYSVGPAEKKCSGTIGCLVTDLINSYILGNNHILADEDKLTKGFPIIQPSSEYGGKYPKDGLASLSKFVRLKSENIVDCAIAQILNPSIASSKIAFLGSPRGSASAKLNETVEKVGSTTELTTGMITGVDASISVDFGKGRLRNFKKQIITTNMSTKGDSGSVLLNKQRYAIGLLIGDSSNCSIYNNIEYVLKELGVRVVTS